MSTGASARAGKYSPAKARQASRTWAAALSGRAALPRPFVLAGAFSGRGCGSPCLQKRAIKCPSPPSAGQMRRQYAAAKPGVSGARSASPGRPKPAADRSSCTNSGWRAKKAAAWASSSSGAKVQVESTSTPPGASSRAAASKMPAAVAAHCATRAGLCWAMAAGSLRNMPSPEQGASTSTRSNQPGSASARRPGVSFVTTALVTPMRSRFWRRISARAGTYSLASKSPCPARAAASWLLLPPGAAHRSHTRMPGRTSSSGAAPAALGSWA